MVNALFTNQKYTTILRSLTIEFVCPNILLFCCFIVLNISLSTVHVVILEHNWHTTTDVIDHLTIGKCRRCHSDLASTHSWNWFSTKPPSEQKQNKPKRMKPTASGYLLLRYCGFAKGAAQTNKYFHSPSNASCSYMNIGFINECRLISICQWTKWKLLQILLGARTHSSIKLIHHHYELCLFNERHRNFIKIWRDIDKPHPTSCTNR